MTLIPRVLHAALVNILNGLHDERDIQPSQQFAYGRPHAHPRRETRRRYSPSGTAIASVDVSEPDCPKPSHGRCECKPDGTWRPSPGSFSADALATYAVAVRHQVQREDGSIASETEWADSMYDLGVDALWRCRWPYRRALERLKGESLRRFLVLDRLFEGSSPAEAWDGLGRPVDVLMAALSICEEVEAFATAEAWAEYEHRPRRWHTAPWVEMSESQQHALTAS